MGQITVNRPAILTKPEAYAPSHQNLALFRVYVGYRSLLSIVLLIMLVSPNTRQLVGSLNPTLYTTTALAYAAILLFFFGAARKSSFGTDWAGEGAMVAYHVISDMELWRTVTALTLHLDFGHIAGNLAYGIIFVWLLSKETGPGIAWASTVLAGAAGNWLNALWQAPGHVSIGASTAVFGAIGVMAALRHRWRPPEFSLRYWAPLGGGFMLMAWLGFGDGNTDIGAHVFGFLAGLAGGYWLSRKDRSWFGDAQRQINALKLTASVLAGSWALALMF